MAEPEPRVGRSAAVAPAAWSALAMLALGLPFVLAPVNRNEQMYVAAARLVARGEHLYGDFAFLQTPGWPWLLSLFVRVAPTANAMVVARFVTLGAVAATGAIVGTLAARWLGGAVAGVLVAVAWLLHPRTVPAVSEASNYAPALAATACALLVAVRYADTPTVRSALFLGALTSVAATFKSYHLVLAVAWLPLLVLRPAPGPRLRTLGAYVVGGIVAALPVLACWAGSPDAFLFDNVGYHQANAAWARGAGMSGLGFTLDQKLASTVAAMARPANVVALLLGLAGFARPGRSRVRAAALLVAWLAAVAGSLLPTPMHPPYAAFPTLVLVALAANGLATPSRTALRVVGAVAMAAAALTVPSTLGTLVRGGPHPTEGLAAYVRTVDDLSAAAAATPRCRVATLAPALALDAGFDIYTELATGPFMYRVVDGQSPRVREATNTVGHLSVDALLERAPPCALVLGAELRGFEEPLAAAAMRRAEFVEVARSGQVVVLIRRQPAGAATD